MCRYGVGVCLLCCCFVVVVDEVCVFIFVNVLYVKVFVIVYGFGL